MPIPSRSSAPAARSRLGLDARAVDVRGWCSVAAGAGIGIGTALAAAAALGMLGGTPNEVPAARGPATPPPAAAAKAARPFEGSLPSAADLALLGLRSPDAR